MTFNAETFLTQTVSGPMSTSITPCPEGEFKAIIDDSDKAIVFSSGSKDGRNWHKVSVLFSILDEGVKAKLNRDKVFVPMQSFLDLTENETALDKSEGKNTKIGKLRDVLGQNEGDWNFPMLKGKGPLIVKVSQRADEKDPSIKYAEIVRVAKIS